MLIESEVLMDNEFVGTGFTKGGKEIDPNNAECYARKTNGPTPQDSVYYVRTERVQGGGLLDPNSIFGSGKISTKVNGLWSKYPFITVSKDTFDMYVNYLKTGNRVNLTHANRNMRWL